MALFTAPLQSNLRGLQSSVTVVTDGTGGPMVGGSSPGGGRAQPVYVSYEYEDRFPISWHIPQSPYGTFHNLDML